MAFAAEMGVDTPNSEFGREPHPDRGTCQSGAVIEACEDARQEKVDQSGRFMRAEMQRFIDKYFIDKYWIDKYWIDKYWGTK